MYEMMMMCGATLEDLLAEAEVTMDEVMGEDEPEVFNVPEYAMEYPFWVAREVDGERWFWGAYATREDAQQAVDYFDEAVIVVNEALA